MKGQVVDIEFYRKEQLPPILAAEAEKQNVQLDAGIVAVKLRIASSPEYEFFSIGKNPAKVRAFLQELAAEDGEDLNEIAKKLISDE